MPELSRADRRQAAARLDELAAELDQIAGWMDTYGQDADKGAVLLESAARDLRAAAWIIKPADHERLPLGWQSAANGRRSG